MNLLQTWKFILEEVMGKRNNIRLFTVLSNGHSIFAFKSIIAIETKLKTHSIKGYDIKSGDISFFVKVWMNDPI